MKIFEWTNNIVFKCGNPSGTERTVENKPDEFNLPFQFYYLFDSKKNLKYPESRKIGGVWKVMSRNDGKKNKGEQQGILRATRVLAEFKEES